MLIEVDPGEGRKDADWANDVARRGLGIRREERLDAIGLLRRRAVFDAPAAGVPAELGKLPFPSIGRVAVEPWIEGVADRRELQDVVDRLDRLGRARNRVERAALFLITTPVADPGGARNVRGQRFGWDPAPILEDGIVALRRSLDALEKQQRASRISNGTPPDPQDAPPKEEVLKRARRALDALKEPVLTLHKEHGKPHPYYALIEADGDGMGAALAGLEAGPVRDAAVEALYAFADSAWPTIESHGGCTFFAGGDELAAYLPLDSVLEVARALAGQFTSLLEPAFRDGGASAPPTLSFGVAVAHVGEDLRRVRRQAGLALREAKRVRRRDQAETSFIEVVEIPRGGAERRCGGATDEFLEQQEELQALLSADELSLSTAHGLLALCAKLGRGDGDGDDTGIDLAAKSVGLRCERQDRRDGEGREAWVQGARALVQRIERLKSWREVGRFAHGILLAERIRRVAVQREPEEREAAVGASSQPGEGD